MLDLADDLTLREREELVAAIYEYRDVFSSGPADMGRARAAGRAQLSWLPRKTAVHASA